MEKSGRKIELSVCEHGVKRQHIRRGCENDAPAHIMHGVCAMEERAGRLRALRPAAGQARAEQAPPVRLQRL